MTNADVLVLGGGPAGITAALALADRGAAVVVAERSTYAGARVGETFPPGIQAPLAALGLWERFAGSGHLPSVGIRSVWGSGEPYERSFIFDPYGVGWHVDRAAFDAGLAGVAEERGAIVLRGTRMLDCRREAGTWTAHLTSPDAPAESRAVRARFVVDATGRACTLARRQGAVRRRSDRLVGIVAHLRPRKGAADVEPVAVIEAAPDGWWYSAPLPGGRMVAAWMTDADLWSGRRDPAAWDRALRQAPRTRERLAAYVAPTVLRVACAHSSHLDPCGGDGWLAAGDAALAWDPLAGNGVHRALQAGPRAAEVALATLDGDGDALGRYREDLARELAEYLRTRDAWYTREPRWTGRPFWARRVAGKPELQVH